MNWFVHILHKEARGRRFRENDRVRYFKDRRKGTGQGLVFTPPMSRGMVKEWDADNRRYRVQHDDGTVIDVHPRNIIVDPIGKSTGPEPIDL